MGLPKLNRLKHWQDFRHVYRKGIRRHSSHLILRAVFVCSDQAPNSRSESLFGISISTKVSKKAVQRNLIKRRMKSAIYELLPRIQNGWKVVIVVKSGAVECKYVDFLRELEQLLVKSKIINGYQRRGLF